MAHIEAKMVGQMLEPSVARAFALHSYPLLLRRRNNMLGVTPVVQYNMFGA